MAEVEFLWWSECPSWRRALSMLRREMSELGLDPGGIKMSEIDTDRQSAERGFPGSPTIRIDGEDIQPPEEGLPGGLTCRIYHLADGRVSPLPDPALLRERLRTAKEQEERT